MSTNFLDRRMDLIHTIENGVNMLTMDTSYPVRLSGKVIKIFSAINDFSTLEKTWTIRNAEKQTILSVDQTKVYDFGNRLVYSNIGTNKYYQKASDVYTKGQYILLIIDFDDKNIHICSFANYVNTTDPRLSDERNAKDVYQWAKQPTKPTYTPQEVHALPDSTVIGDGTLNIQVNGTNIATFSANSSTNVIADVSIDASKVEASTTNGNIKIDGKETKVYTHPGSGTNPHGTTKSDIGLSKVGNFKAVSTEENQGLGSGEKTNAKKNLGLENVGNFYAVSTEPNQGLTADQKAAARSNIGVSESGGPGFSGSYTDLGNKPKINNVTLEGNKSLTDLGININDGTLTVNVTDNKGVKVTKTFSANSSSNTTVDVTMPTKVSDLSNDSGFTNNKGTVTGIKMNGSSKTVGGDGVVDLGTIITDVSEVSKFEMFDVAASPDVTTVPVDGIDEPVSKVEFDKAIAFENTDGKTAFLKDSNMTVYQSPETVSSDRSVIPVAKITQDNVNTINSSVIPLLFPYINTGYLESFEAIHSIRGFVQRSGVVNDNFIEQFCYTAAELIQLSIVNYNETTHSISTNINLSSTDTTTYIRGIFNNHKEDEYFYYIGINGNPDYKNGHVYYTDTKVGLAIYPIKKSTHKFSFIDTAPSMSNIACNGRSMELNLLNGTAGDIAYSSYYASIVGNWWSSNFTDKSGNIGGNTWSGILSTYTGSGTREDPYIRYPFDNRFRFSDIKTGIYTEAVSDQYWHMYNLCRNATAIHNKSLSVDEGFLATTDMTYDNVFKNINNQYAPFIDKLLKYYCNDDGGYYGILRERLISSNNNTVMGNFTPNYNNIVYNADRTDGMRSISVISGSSPVSVVAELPESSYNTLRENYFANSNVPPSLYSASSSYDKSTKDSYKFFSPVNQDNQEQMELIHLAYKLLCYDVDTINNDSNKLNYETMWSSDVRKLGTQKAKIMVSQDLLGNTAKHNTYVFDTGYNGFNDSKFKTMYVTHFLSKFQPRCIDERSDGKLGTDIGLSRAVLRSKNPILFAKDCITFTGNSNDGDMKFTNGSTTYTLYKVESSSSYIVATYNNIKNVIKKYGYMYLYYSDSTGNYYRIKLVVDMNTASSKWNENASTALTDFDYVLRSGQVALNITDSSSGKFGEYDLAYCAARSYTKTQVNTATPQERVCFVHNAYKLYPETGILDNLVDGVAMPVYKSSSVGEFDTTSLVVRLDYVLFRYRNGAVTNDKAYTLTDTLGDVSIYQDGPAPMLSKTISEDGKSFIHSLDAYQDFISNVYVTQDTPGIKSNVTSITTSGTVKPILNSTMLKYINGVGIREEYYRDRTIYDFFNDMLNYDLAKPKSEQTIRGQVSRSNIVFNKGAFDNIRTVNSVNRYIDGSNNVVTITSDAIIVDSIKFDNKFGFNKSSIYNPNREDVVGDYISRDSILVNTEYAGRTKLMSVPLSGPDGIMLNINGILGNIYCDNLTWDVLLTALSNNKGVDVLSDSLYGIKSTINKSILNDAQNINSRVTVAKNVSPDSIVATYDTGTDLYTYNQFEGYGTQSNPYPDNAKREINNRGVIVFETDNGYSVLHRNGDSRGEREKWSEEKFNSNVYAKRMYISPEGIVCTKEYYDNANTTGRAIIPDNLTLQYLYQRIAELEARIDQLENK